MKTSNFEGMALLKLEDGIYNRQYVITGVVTNELVLVTEYDFLTGVGWTYLARLSEFTGKDHRWFINQSELKKFMDVQGDRHNERVKRGRPTIEIREHDAWGKPS